MGSRSVHFVLKRIGLPTLHSSSPKDETFGAILTHRGKHYARTFLVYYLDLYSINTLFYRFLY